MLMTMSQLLACCITCSITVATSFSLELLLSLSWLKRYSVKESWPFDRVHATRPFHPLPIPLPAKMLGFTL